MGEEAKQPAYVAEGPIPRITSSAMGIYSVGITSPQQPSHRQVPGGQEI